ncbi:hypothetical protein V5738_03200 [Salinisphaera sp. SPP-AMP-43]|uniref:hypothetical protein n=1 Tax=Salinisphaera sp. SPP-AMP-43 TaxID=3121288 RepID=UPI003C6DF396
MASDSNSNTPKNSERHEPQHDEQAQRPHRGSQSEKNEQSHGPADPHDDNSKGNGDD